MKRKAAHRHPRKIREGGYCVDKTAHVRTGRIRPIAAWTTARK